MNLNEILALQNYGNHGDWIFAIDPFLVIFM